MRLTVLVVVGLVAGCSADPVQEAEDAVFAKLVCEDVARPSTLARLRAVFDHPSPQTAAAFATNPQGLATLVSIAGPEAEGVVVALRNATRAEELFAHGWDGVQCGEPFALDCTAGDETASVSCDDGVANRVDLKLAKCTLGGMVLDGTVAIVRDG